jgi:hypothetical protein
MPRDPESQSWWHTLPGVITAIAALITAVGGLVAVLIQTGVIDTSRSATDPVPADASSSVTATSSASREPAAVDASSERAPAAADASAGALRPWAESEAALTDRNGVATVLRAETLSNCISVNHVLTLNGSQDIPFEKMRSFEVVRVDPDGAPQANATVIIRLLDGRAIEGRIGVGCDAIFGYNDLGRFTISFRELKRVEFRR